MASPDVAPWAVSLATAFTAWSDESLAIARQQFGGVAFGDEEE